VVNSHSRISDPHSAFNLRLQLSPQSEGASMELLHLLHAVSLASQVLGHGVPLAAIQETVWDADMAGGSSTARLRHGWQQHPALPLSTVAVGLLAVLLVHVVAILPAADDEDILIKMTDSSALNTGYFWWQTL